MILGTQAASRGSIKEMGCHYKYLKYINNDIVMNTFSGNFKSEKKTLKIGKMNGELKEIQWAWLSS